MSKAILTDTCFWLGLVDSKDQHHEKSNVIADLIEDYNIVIPWPCIYETISTKLARKRTQLLLFEDHLKRQNISFLDDTGYKDKALERVFKMNRRGATLSLTDGVIRELLSDVNIRLHYLVTFNVRDFEDICIKRQIQIISE